jgi:hypothetical protein
MPQDKKVVPIVFLDGTTGEAVAYGNNAAWLCRCGRELPLIGRSGRVHGVTDGRRVDCPAPGCGRRYFVVPEDGDFKKVVKVEEVR